MFARCENFVKNDSRNDSRNELHLCLLSNRINLCPSCKEQLVYVVNEFCRECPKCCRVFECDDYEQFQEENRGRSSTAPPTTNFHLKNVFRKWNIDKMFSSSEVAFLSKVIAQFQEITFKSVNLKRKIALKLCSACKSGYSWGKLKLVSLRLK